MDRDEYSILNIEDWQNCQSSYLSAICEVKAQYNILIQKEKQLNLFKHFNLK